MAIFISLNAGATNYTNFTTIPARSFTNTSVYGKNYDCYGTITDGGVGAKEGYISVATLNDTEIVLTFDYDINRVDLFGKTSQSTGGTSVLAGATISENKREVHIKTSLNTSLSNAYLMVYINGDFGQSYNITQNLENCTSSITSNKIDEGMQEITLTVNKNNYVFGTIPTISIGDIVYDFEVDETGRIATITVNVDGDVEINAIARENIKVFIEGTIENATCNYEDGEFIDNSKDIIITANDGYTFKSHYSYRKGVVTYTINNQTTYLIIETSSVHDNIYLDDVYNATRVVEQVGTFVNLYKTNNDELTELSKVRFYQSAGQTEDYGTYISTLYILPFDLPADIIGDTSSIILGILDSNVDSTLLLTYTFDLDGGTIEVPLKYNNIYDYVNTECILHLPFLDKVYLNTEYVIGQTLTVTFTIDLYSGTLTANIVSSFNNEIVASVQGLVGTNIPFIQKSTNNIIGTISNINKNKINRCFIEVNRNIPYTKGKNILGGQVIEFGKIGDYQGYLECDNVVLNTTATSQEQEEIKNLLRNGVFIYE